MVSISLSVLLDNIFEAAVIIKNVADQITSEGSLLIVMPPQIIITLLCSYPSALCSLVFLVTSCRCLLHRFCTKQQSLQLAADNRLAANMVFASKMHVEKGRANKDSVLETGHVFKTH